MTIRVTQKDINDGVTMNGYKCAVALSLQRTFGVSNFHVATRHLVINEMEIFDLPDHVVDFIVRFDNGKEVRPITFTLPTYIVEHLTPEKKVRAKKAKRQTKRTAVLV